MSIGKDVIYIISVIRPLDVMATSTHIMTSTLITGIKKNGFRLIFFPICEYPEEIERLKENFSPIADAVIPLPSGFGHGLNKYKQLELMLYYSLSRAFYKKHINRISKELLFPPDLIITHSPSFEAVCYGKTMHDVFPEASYYQYWSDPIALSGILPEQLGVKRLPFKWVERKALKYADRIIYGTKTLMHFQRDLYPDLADKMRYIDIPYVEKTTQENKALIKNSLLYAGNYYSNLRNIKPLIEAVSQMPEYTLDVYGSGDCQNPGVKNITFHGRITPDELSKIEGQYESMVCLLNHSCIQIPGKIFYDTIKPTKILVISDGPYSEQILAYLSSYERFVFCKNEAKEIMKAIGSLDGSEVNMKRIREEYSPEAIAKDLLYGGRKA